VNSQDIAAKMKGKIDTIEEVMTTLVVSTRLEEQAEKIKAKITSLEEKRRTMLEARMDSHWMYIAFDEMADLVWPQGDPDTTYAESDSDTDTETDVEDLDVGNKLGGRGGGGTSGQCTVM
jgi:hypothetical protein